MKRPLISLQILRALAAWMVVYSHYVQIILLDARTFPEKLFSTRGNFGVDLFFVISGFVMFHATRPGASPRPFLAKRILRIVPAYYFHSALLAAVFFVVPAAFPLTDFSVPTFLLSLLFVPHPNPSGIGIVPFLTVGWTLNYEMFFYALLALCLALFRTRAFAVAALLTAGVPLFYPSGWVYGEVLASPLLKEFACGILLGKLWERHGGKITDRPAWGVAAALGALALLALPPRDFWFLAASLGVFAGLCLETRLQNLPGLARVGVFLGNISYSTYLVHVLVLGLTGYFLPGHLPPLADAARIAGVTAMVLLGSWASYVFVENAPALRRLRKRLGGFAPKVPV